MYICLLGPDFQMRTYKQLLALVKIQMQRFHHLPRLELSTPLMAVQEQKKRVVRR